MKNTAEFTAAAAVDPDPTPAKLFIAGRRLYPQTAQELGTRVTGVHFALKRVMSTGMLRVLIAVMKRVWPGKKDDVMPMWVGLQYAYTMSLGTTTPDHFDNDRYPGIHWEGVEDVVRQAFDAASTGS